MSPGRRPLLKPPLPPGAAQWAPATVLALGLAATALLLVVDSLRESLVSRDFALLRAIGGVQTDLTASHLWMEEWLSGDDIPPERIWSGIERSRATLAGLLRAGPRSWLESARAEDREVAGSVRELAAEVGRFSAIVDRRRRGFARGEDVGVGSPLDVEYDAAFGRASARAEGLSALVEARLEANLARSRGYSRSIVAGWGAIVVGAFAAMLIFERRRRQAEEALLARETQLLQAQKMEAVGRLAGGIAHDINNYLAAITAQAELAARKAPPGDRVVERMEGVAATALRASALLERLLAFSRRQPLHPEAVNLNLVVGELEAMLRNLLGETVELETRLAAELWDVLADPAQVEQVLMNLLVNAREAMPGGGRVVIETENATFRGADVAHRPVTTPGDYVMLAVSDTGSGIPPEVQTRLFEPFYTTKNEHSGLGLATVYGIVKQSGGNVWAYSEPGRGTTFRVYLPRTRQQRAEPGRPAGRRPAAPGGSERILLVEDNRELRESVSSLLESMGYRVAAAGDGAEALRWLEAAGRGVDLVIADVVMPGLSGPELLERIRLRLGPVPALFVSGYSAGVAGLEGPTGAGADLLAKPFSADALARKVREVLDHREATDSPAGSPSRREWFRA